MLLVQEVAQREGDGPSQAPIGDDELVLGGQLHDAELVDEPGQAQHAQHAGDEAEEEGADDEGPVPVVGASHRGDAKEDEDEGLADAAPHLQEVFDGGVGLVGDVGLHIGAHHHSRGYKRHDA